MPRVSVAMPVYNREKYVAESIESVLNQTYTDFEFLICDDGSTDNTWNILADYAKQDKKIKLFKNETNLGIAATRNKLILNAIGEYLAIQDSDDLWTEDKLELQLSFLLNYTKYNLVACRFIYINQYGNYKYNPLFNYYGDVSKYLDFNSIISNCSILLKLKLLKSIFPDSIFYNPNYLVGEDYDLLCRIKEHIKIYVLKEKLVRVRIHEDNITKDRIGQPVTDNIVCRCLVKLGLTKLNVVQHSDIIHLIQVPWKGGACQKLYFVKFILNNKTIINKQQHLKIRLVSIIYFNPSLFSIKIIWLFSPTTVLKSFLFVLMCLWNRKNKIIRNIQ